MDFSGKNALRQSLLALVMLLILLAATGAAWLLVLQGQRRQAVGQNIVDEIHAQKLSHWYPEKATVQWYVGSKGSSVVGWQAVIRNSKGGQHEGLRIEAIGSAPPRIQSRAVEKWTLDDPAASGEYRSEIQSVSVSNAGAVIRLQDGKVSMTQLFPGLIGQAGAQVRSNYLPEGTTPLALRLVAQQKADALFSTIIDDHPNFGMAIDFVSVRVRYDGAHQQGSASLDKVIYSASGAEITYWLDGEGGIARIDTGEGFSWVAVTEKQITEHYPAASTQVWELSDNIFPQGPGFWKRLLSIGLQSPTTQ
jgi:hypothetical protein